MVIKILYDEKKAFEGYLTGWGFSCLVDGRVLFDTGGSATGLLKNLKRAGVNISGIETVVISHDHWDHIGGLWPLLNKAPKARVYVCHNSGGAFKKKVLKNGSDIVEVKDFARIAPGIFTSGEFCTRYKDKPLAEQALVIKTSRGIVLIAGCAHPGIVKLINRAKLKFPAESLLMAMGGFHLKDSSKQVIKGTVKRLKELGLKQVAPLHCSGVDAQSEFQKAYGNNFIKVAVGQEISL